MKLESPHLNLYKILICNICLFDVFYSCIQEKETRTQRDTAKKEIQINEKWLIDSKLTAIRCGTWKYCSGDICTSRFNKLLSSRKVTYSTAVPKCLMHSARISIVLMFSAIFGEWLFQTEFKPGSLRLTLRRNSTLHRPRFIDWLATICVCVWNGEFYAKQHFGWSVRRISHFFLQ